MAAMRGTMMTSPFSPHTNTMRSVRDDIAGSSPPRYCCLLFGAPSVPDDVRGRAAPCAGETVDVANETALIIWDEATQTEHFIRQAQFVGTSRDFGFLVPTPNPPYVEAIEPGLFANLAHFTEPKTEYRTESRTFNAFGCVKAPEPDANSRLNRPHLAM